MNENKVKKMNVAQVRKALHTLRSKWENHSPASPICLSEELEFGLSLSDFCFVFVMNHHSKRQVAKENQSKMEDSPESK